MGTLIASAPRRLAAPEGTDVSKLRSPGEYPALAVCMVSNLLVLGLCFAMIFAGTAWLGTHPMIAMHVGWMRTVAIAAIIALPATPIGRHANVHAARNNGMRVNATQFPELYERLLVACRKLGIRNVPELIISREINEPAIAYSVWTGETVVVLNAQLVPKVWKDGLDWLAFAMGGALGALRLGHTRWWVELTTTYARRIPGLRTPLMLQWCYSRDRCAAFLYPNGIKSLLAQVVGKNAVREADSSTILAQVDEEGGLWDFVAAVSRKEPLFTARARALYEHGFFDRAEDLLAPSRKEGQ